MSTTGPVIWMTLPAVAALVLLGIGGGSHKSPD